MPEARASTILDELVVTIASRKASTPDSSYTAQLFHAGVDRIGRKIGEEAAEVIIAAKNADPEELAAEVADLWFHSLVLLAAVGVDADRVWDRLRERRGRTGLR